MATDTPADNLFSKRLSSPHLPKGEFTAILAKCAAGDRAAQNVLMACVLAELRTMAQQRLARESQHHTLQATALVNEAYIKLVDEVGQLRKIPSSSRNAFYGCAVRAMCQVLINHARNKNADVRRPPGARVPLDDHADAAARDSVDDSVLAESLERLERVQPDLAQMIRLRHFGGVPREELADWLGIPTSTFDRRYREAKVRLRLLMEP
ncbi:MAG: hypothetical protein KF805_08980 [Phycisphaeraceae bacterium]|nr:hypothetical protein [Phycisphaeraceae bacterium]